MSQANGPYQLHAYFSGRLRVTLGDQVVLDAESDQPSWHSSQPRELNYDYHALQVEYEKLSKTARVALYWSGPQFQLEPIDGRQLFHDRKQAVDQSFQRGETLVRALRCAACHEFPSEPPAIAAPALDRLALNIHATWLVAWLSDSSSTPTNLSESDEVSRRMPHFQLKDQEAKALAAYLLAKSLPPGEKQRANELLPTASADKADRKSTPGKNEKNKKKKNAKEDEPAPPPKTPIESGRELVMTLGCLACHRVGEVGHSDLFGGGDLSAIAAKRPRLFFDRWLAEPETLNSQHRMPVFDLTGEERRDISTYLASLGRATVANQSAASMPSDVVAQGERLFAEYRCGACHAGPTKPVGAELPKTKISAKSNWERACSGSTGVNRQPQFRLGDSDRKAVRALVSQLNPDATIVHSAGSLLRERGCIACHSRDESPGLGPWLTAVAEKNADLAPLIPAMTPPPLISIGDKLHDQALRDAIRRQGAPLRPYLRARMPRFALSDTELDSLIQEFITADRIPPNSPTGTGLASSAASRPAGSSENAHAGIALDAIGTRLVTPDGFGCTSCHQVGSVLPVKAPLNARGADLTLLGRRIRREWFDRWVRNPSRIVPRMEMPSVQIAVRGVLDENLDQQLAAVWEVLNRPGFEPPEPNPVRVVRHTGIDGDRRAHVITDVVRTKSGNFVKPLLIGLSNRHNILFDLETSRLAAWSIGDLARQRTEGKSWFWETAGKDLITNLSEESELTLVANGQEQQPQRIGQFASEFDELEHLKNGNGLRLRYRLYFGEPRSTPQRQIRVSQSFNRWGSELTTAIVGGVTRTVEVSGVPENSEVRLRVVGDEHRPSFSLAADARTLNFGMKDEGFVGVRVVSPRDARFERDGSLRAKASTPIGSIRWELHYVIDFPVDHFPLEPSEPVPFPSSPLNVVPGFSAVRTPLSDDIMPTALAWRPDGELVIASLKGQIWIAFDRDNDGLVDHLEPFCDGLAAPYGIYATNQYVDVINKYALLRLFDEDGNWRADRWATLASGWGHTADYHDWAVGLSRDPAGNYFMALPCQQDQRSAAGAFLRGEFLRLAPRQPTTDDPRLYAIERISRGHRFPMGLARNRDGEFFLTDNQGNYNPFNELNHIRPDAHFGFVNALEKTNDARPPLTAPAIDIPHPWTRSVNGICFLDMPSTAQARRDQPSFGPFEGHLIGCEYDTRRLVRMTLHKVGETYQGAAYPFSYDQPPSGPPLLGPIVCAVSPDGDLYVGGLRDSGWGGANNIGEIVRLRFEPAGLPNGISEMRATSTGFTLDFVAPVGAQANQVQNYALASYTRESTPAYGGSDIDRRTEKIDRITLSNDRRRVTLELKELRAGYVYELHVKNLAPKGQLFFPAEAHYTLRTIPR